MLTHGGLSSNAEALVDCWQFSKNDVYSRKHRMFGKLPTFSQLHCLPFFHIHGLFVAFNCTVFSHSTLLWRPKFDVNDAIKHIPESTVMMGVPTYYRFGIIGIRNKIAHFSADCVGARNCRQTCAKSSACLFARRPHCRMRYGRTFRRRAATRFWRDTE